MTDIALTWNTALARGDWTVAASCGDLVTGNDLETAVLLSLFTDRLANGDDVIPDGTTDRRGWWGDTYEQALSTGGYAGQALVGSRLWLLDRAKQTTATLRRAEDYAKEALQWLITEGIAAKIAASATWFAAGKLGILVSITKADATTQSFAYDWAWGGLQ